jgi:hypothetical protein
VYGPRLSVCLRPSISEEDVCNSLAKLGNEVPCKKPHSKRAFRENQFGDSRTVLGAASERRPQAAARAYVPNDMGAIQYRSSARMQASNCQVRANYIRQGHILLKNVFFCNN